MARRYVVGGVTKALQFDKMVSPPSSSSSTLGAAFTLVRPDPAFAAPRSPTATISSDDENDTVS